MKVSKILAGMSAAAIAASAMSLVSFAADPVALSADLSGGTVSLIDELNEDGSVKTQGVLTGSGVALTDVYGIDFNVTVGADTAAAIEAGEWVGGGIGYNSDSTGWASTEWSFQDGVKPVTGVKADDGSYDFVLKGDAAAFADTDTFAQVWLQNWSTSDFTFNAVTLLSKDGNAIAVITNASAGVKDVELTPDNCNFNAEANVFYLFGDASKGEGGYFETAEDLAAANVTAVTFVLNIDDAAVEAGDWIGGGIGFNSETTGWESHEWTTQAFATDEEGNYADADGDGLADRVKECCVQKIADGKYAYTVVADASIFSATDTYAQVWLQDWSSGTVTLDSIILNPTTVYANPEQPKIETPVESEPVSEVDSKDPTDSKDVDSKATDSKATTSSKAANNAANKNPSTGAAALAAVGVALAGAAVVATKKRK